MYAFPDESNANPDGALKYTGERAVSSPMNVSESKVSAGGGEPGTVGINLLINVPILDKGSVSGSGFSETIDTLDEVLTRVFLSLTTIVVFANCLLNVVNNEPSAGPFSFTIIRSSL